jgi:hypothetical protein
LTAYRSDACPKKIIRPKHSSFIERTKRSAKAFRLGDRGGRRMDFDAVAHEETAEGIRVLCIPIDDEIAPAAKKLFVNIRGTALPAFSQGVSGLVVTGSRCR